MGAVSSTLTAPTREELEGKVREWEREAEGKSLGIMIGWDSNFYTGKPPVIEHDPETGYSIYVRAHT